jgi:hypothetical protein
MLQILKSDPNLRNISNSPPKQRQGAPAPGKRPDSNKSAEGGSGKSAAKIEAKKAVCEEDEKADTKVAENESGRATLVAAGEGGSDDSNSVVMHPSMVPAFAPPGSVTSIPSSSADGAAAKEKALEKAQQQKNMILAMKQKYKKGMAGGLDLQGGAVNMAPISPTAMTQRSDAKDSSPYSSPAKESDTSDKSDAWGLKELSPSPPKGGSPDTTARGKSMQNAEGFVDFNWREERLDSKKYASAAAAAVADSKNVDTEGQAAVMAAIPSSVSNPTATNAPPRVRLNPRGARAKALANKEKDKGEKGVAGGGVALQTMVVERNVVDAEEAFQRQDTVYVEGNDDREGGVVPVPAYDVGLAAGEARSVEWKDPDPEFLASMTKSVQERIPRERQVATIDPEERKESLFKQRQRQYAEMTATREAKPGAITAGGMIKSQPGALASMAGKKESAGAKTVQWEIKEIDNPVLLPEESIVDKYDPNDPDSASQGKDYEPALPAAALQDKAPSTTLFDDGDPISAPVRLNHELRNEFFSPEGVSLTFLPQGADLTLLDVEDETAGKKTKTKKSKKLIGQQSGRVNTGERGDEQEVSESESETDSDEENPLASSGEEDSEGEYVYNEQPTASFFLQAYSLFDDMFSHIGPVLNKKPYGSPGKKAMLEGVQAATAELVADAENDEGEGEIGTTQQNKATGDKNTKEDEKKDAKVAGRPLELPPRRRLAPQGHAGGQRPADSALSMLTRGIATAEEMCGLEEVLKGPVLSEYHQCKRRLLDTADGQAAVPALTSTGWTVVALIVVDAIVRMRRLLFKQQDSRAQSTNNEAAEKWADRVAACVAKAQKSKSSNVVCDGAQLLHLKSFFDDLK